MWLKTETVSLPDTLAPVSLAQRNYLSRIAGRWTTPAACVVICVWVKAFGAVARPTAVRLHRTHLPLSGHIWAVFLSDWLENL